MELGDQRRQQQANPPSTPLAGESFNSENFEAFYQRRLRPEIEFLEVERKAVIRRILLRVALIVLVGTPMTYLFAVRGLENVAAFTMTLTITCTWCTVLVLRSQYISDFKDSVMRPLVCAYDQSLEYNPDECVPQQIFQESKLFPHSPNCSYSGEDLVSGTVGKTAMYFSDVRYGAPKHDSAAGSPFNGVFFSADFNKKFTGTTFVLPDRAQKWFGSMGQLLQSLEKDFGQLVKLENPEFERAFVVYSDSQVEARYVLTPSLMQRILNFRRLSKRLFRMSFTGSRVNIAVDMGKSLFEVRLFRTLLNPLLYESFWHDLNLLAGLVEELNLNTRIWTKF